MRTTRTLIGAKALRAVYDGVNAIYEPVRRTFGPQGRNVLLYRNWGRGPRITNDGVTVAECQEPKDIFVRLAAQAFKESCKRTNEKVGDGTTCTTIIGGKLFNTVYSVISEIGDGIMASNNIGVMTLRKNLLNTAEKVKLVVKDSAKKVEIVEDLEKIAVVSVEDPKLGKTIAGMVWETGVDGFIDVTDGFKGEIETEVIKGMRFPARVSAKAFINSPAKYEMVANDCPVVVTNYELDNVKQVAKMVDPLLAKNPKIIIIAPKFSNEVLEAFFKAMFVINEQGMRVKKPGVDIYPVSVPSLRTEQFDDLAVYCGANFIDKNKGRKLDNTTERDLGFLEKLVVKDVEAKEDAIATGGGGTREEVMPDVTDDVDGTKVLKEKQSSKIAERIEMLKGQLVETQQEQYKKLLERRIASMASAVGVIRVGDSTQASALYLKLKVEDAVFACKAALRGGYVKGGGLCLKEIAETLPENDLMKPALLAPYEQIQSSVDGGIDISDDIIDPAEVIYYAIEHAVGVVANLITVDVITQEMEDPLMGEGEYAIAKAMNELVISDKIHKGQLKESEVEAERDKLNGLTTDEYLSMDNG
jgi:chaperonin GroEL